MGEEENLVCKKSNFCQNRSVQFKTKLERLYFGL
jgi:hypothetical protein